MARAKVVSLSEPPFTLKDLRDAVPKHCFERNGLKSAMFVFRDLLFATLLWMFVAPWIDSIDSNAVIKFCLWAVFALAQGTILTGVWVIAHGTSYQREF